MSGNLVEVGSQLTTRLEFTNKDYCD